MLDLIANLLSLKMDFDFWKKKKARRKFERENNLPKKIMIHPIWKMFGFIMIFVIITKTLIGHFFLSDYKKNKTIKKISKIELILEKQKKDIGTYPRELNTIIRNNPLRKNITKDYWNNNFYYELTENGKNYILISMGKDEIMNTKDDIKN